MMHLLQPLLCAYSLIVVVVLLCVTVTATVTTTIKNRPKYPDPEGFMFGVATASYQIEGAAHTDGRGDSIWDTFASSKTPDGRNHTHLMDSGLYADDSYHKYHEDIKLMKELGVSSFRFSIGWPRIFPNGSGDVNQKGIDHYDNVIDALIEAGIDPVITMYHWDLPQALDDEYGGWLSPDIAQDFLQYAMVLLDAYGDRVTKWITFNEPWTFCFQGYGNGVHAPGRCSDRDTCFEGDSSTEPYMCSHNVLRAHGLVSELFSRMKSMGLINSYSQMGMTLNSPGSVPFSDSPADKEASDRYMIFNLGWYADPLYFGDYSDIMKQNVGDRLPSFTALEKERFLEFPPEFFGLNHYTSNYIKNDPDSYNEDQRGGWREDQHLIVTNIDAHGKDIGPVADSPWLLVVPWGIRTNLNWLANRYGNPPVLITENGCDVPGEDDMSIDVAVHDEFRVNYYRDYTDQVLAARHVDGVNVIGYFMWSLEDNFEWADGYRFRFGIVYVDYLNGFTRYVKDSFKWAKARFQYGGIDTLPAPGPETAGGRSHASDDSSSSISSGSGNTTSNSSGSSSTVLQFAAVINDDTSIPTAARYTGVVSSNVILIGMMIVAGVVGIMAISKNITTTTTRATTTTRVTTTTTTRAAAAAAATSENDLKVLLFPKQIV